MNRPIVVPALLSLLLVLLSWPTVAAASRAPVPRVTLQIVDREDGRVLPQTPHRGQTWLPGEPGHRYAVRLRNTGPQRVLVVLSVDGVNAITGQTADTRQAGYVLSPWQELDVEGWRKSMGTVAGFVFVDPSDSYATRTGRPDNVGVIGIAVYDEKPTATGIARIADAHPSTPRMERQPQPAAQARSAEAAAAPTADTAARGYSPAPAAPSLGTGHGRIESSQAHTTTFARQSRPAQVVQLRYDTWQGLLAQGVPVSPPYHRQHRYDAPQAFPNGFVPDPPCCAHGW